MNNTDILRALVDAQTSRQVAAILDVIEPDAAYGWRALGDRENNVPTINLSTSPPRSLVERLTNAIDAVIEDKALDSPETNFLRSPKEAVIHWFNVPDAGLHQLSLRDRQKLADMIRITLLDGDSDLRPTVQVRDLGFGIETREFHETILSLNRSNKLNKFYLCGAFGQGGASTFAASQYTLVLSRARKDPETISGTIVRYNPLNPEEYKHGRYEYLVNATNVVLSGPVKDLREDFLPGTVVRHISYEMEGCVAPLGPGQNSIYGLMQSVLFDPLLPFWVEDFRKGRSIRRTVIGSRNRLLGRQEEEGERWPGVRYYQPPAHYHLGHYGDLLIEYWVVDPAKGTKENRRPNEAYVDSRNPIVLTLNGQVQGEISVSLIRRDAKLPMVASRLIVHILCDKLTPEGRRLLFPSTREQARRGEVFTEISQALTQLLANDEMLRDIEGELREAGLVEMDLEAKTEIKRRVAEFLAITEGEPAASSGPKEDPDGTVPVGKGRRGPRRPLAPLATTDPPTWIDILGEAPLELRAGRVQILRVNCDAPDFYYSDDEEQSRVRLYVSAPVTITGSTPLRGGRIRYWVSVPEALPVGSKGIARAELRPPSAPGVSIEKEFVIVEAIKGKEDESTLSLPEFEIHWINPDDGNWATVGFTSTEEASQVAESGDKVHIYLSSEFDPYRARFRLLADRDAAVGRSFKSRYEILTAAYCLLQLIRGRQARKSVSGEAFERLDEFERQERTRVGWFVATLAWRETRGIRDLIEEE